MPPSRLVSMAKRAAAGESSQGSSGPPANVDPDGPTRRRSGSLLPHVVAIVAVLSSAAVAITVPFIDSSLERDRLEWQTDEAKREEFRRLLDGSMQRLWSLTQFMVEVQDEQTDEHSTRASRRLLSRRATTFLRQLSLDTERIALRVGAEAAVARAHNGAASNVVGFEFTLRTAVESRERLNEFDLREISEMYDDFAKFKKAARRYLAAPVD